MKNKDVAKLVYIQKLHLAPLSLFATTLIKKLSFSHILRNLEGLGAKSYMTNDLHIYGENICAFPHILGTPSSYMTLHPIPSEFPNI